MPAPETIVTDIPQRLDRLPWGRFHTRVALGLGVSWVLDGLEVTIAGAIAGALKASPRLGFSDADIGLAASFYLLGAVFGALLFGWLTDRLGRKKLFFVTLSVYLLATAATAFSWNLASFCFFRLLTGAGIGGEYAAINSTIQELMPARYRGRIDLAINGTFWLGAAAGAAASVVLLDPLYFAPDTGWRLAFFIGAALGLVILALRAFLPESPRWLLIHGKTAQAERIVAAIEDEFRAKGRDPGAPGDRKFAYVARKHTPLSEVYEAIVHRHRTRSLVGLALMAAQAFFYNAIFFTYALILTRFYGLAPDQVGWHLIPFALGNVAGPLVLGPLFDTLGRRPMIAGTYAFSGLGLAIVGYLFWQGLLDARQQTIAWSCVFFVASAAASSAYLTVSEIFPVEIRALAIALFYAFGTALGGVAAPYIFGELIGTGSRFALFAGYLFGALGMIGAAWAAWRWGIAAERRPLEEVAPPLSAREP
ncbi:MAG: MFS transporter [Rhodoblastus sp.]